MHSLSLLAYLVASSMSMASVNSALIKVQVGKNSTGQLTTAFNPNQVTAQVGDTIQFEFIAKNHSVTQSSFAEPCTRQFNTVLNLAGADSGFMPVPANATEIPTWTVQVNDASSPQWFFCNQANHCNSGMVFAINAPASGDKTFDAFATKAVTANHPDPALNQTAPFTPPSASPSSSAGSDPLSSADPLSGGGNDTVSSSSSDGADPLAATDAPANAAPSPYGSASGSDSIAYPSLSISSPASSTGTGTAAQDQQSTTSGGGGGLLPTPTASRSAGSKLRVGGGGGGLVVSVCVALVGLVVL